MPEWEYIVRNTEDLYGRGPDRNRGIFQETLNAYGADGWELIHAPVSGHSQTYIFKRQVQ